MTHASLPERTRNLANRYLNLGHKNFAAQTALGLLGRGRFKKQLQRFPEIVPGLLDKERLAGTKDIPSARRKCYDLWKGEDHKQILLLSFTK